MMTNQAHDVMSVPQAATLARKLFVLSPESVNPWPHHHLDRLTKKSETKATSVTPRLLHS